MIFSVKIQEYLLPEDPRWKFIHTSFPPSLPPFTAFLRSSSPLSPESHVAKCYNLNIELRSSCMHSKQVLTPLSCLPCLFTYILTGSSRAIEGKQEKDGQDGICAGEDVLLLSILQVGPSVSANLWDESGRKCKMSGG